MASQLLVDIEKTLHELCAERAIPVESVRFFGSRALGTAQDESDVDILVDFQPGVRVGLLACIALEQELSASLGRKVDLVTRGALRPRIGEQVLAELVAV